MKRWIVPAAFAVAAGLLAVAAGGAGAGEGEEEAARYAVSQPGAGSFVIVDTREGTWEHVSIRPNQQGRLTVMRGEVGGDRVESLDVMLWR